MVAYAFKIQLQTQTKLKPAKAKLNQAKVGGVWDFENYLIKLGISFHINARGIFMRMILSKNKTVGLG